MSSDSTRRQFLKISALGVAAATTNGLHLEAADAETSAAQPGEVNIRLTYADQRFSATRPARWSKEKAAPGETISVDPSRKFQEILGFGAAFTDAACYMFQQLTPTAREQLFQELFHPAQMGLNVCRTCIGASDYSTKLYSYNDGDPDPALTRFSIDHDRQYVIPMLREARQVNPDLFLFSSPWSPPGWMKANGSMLGGCMERKHMAPYANYFVKFLQSYAAEGVPIQAVTVQNEVDTEQDGRMPACTWPQEYEVDFVRQHLGLAFEHHNIKTKIWLVDHNYNLWGRAICELQTPDLRKYANSIAWHGYVGQPEWMSRVHDAFPDAEMYWTEGGPDYAAPDYATDWCNWSSTFTGILRNWCRSITGWNLALDEHGRPNIGPFGCGGLVTIDSRSKEVTRSGQFRAFAHYSRCIRRGARRIDTQSASTAIHHVGVENPDGEKVLILTNPGKERKVQLTMGQRKAEVTLPQDSVATCWWRG